MNEDEKYIDKEYEICKKACSEDGCYLPQDCEFHTAVANTPLFLRAYFFMKGEQIMADEVLKIIEKMITDNEKILKELKEKEADLIEVVPRIDYIAVLKELKQEISKLINSHAKKEQGDFQPTLETQKKDEQLYDRKKGASIPDNQHDNTPNKIGCGEEIWVWHGKKCHLNCGDRNPFKKGDYFFCLECVKKTKQVKEKKI